MNNQVGKFYDEIGWKYTGQFSEDSIINENLHPAASEYVSKVRGRIQEKIGKGASLLDVGCGPIQYPEYVSLSEEFDTRVCVDLSYEALKLAKQKIGKRGLYLHGDFLNLEIAQYGPFDGAVLINVLYHIEKERQEMIVNKILKNLAPTGRLIVIYSNPKSVSAVFTRIGVLVKRMIKGKVKLDFSRNKNPIYFFQHNRAFWKRFNGIAKVEIFPWRTMNPQIEKLFFKNLFFAKHLFKILFEIEKISSWGIFCEYYMVVLIKLD